MLVIHTGSVLRAALTARPTPGTENQVASHTQVLRLETREGRGYVHFLPGSIKCFL